MLWKSCVQECVLTVSWPGLKRSRRDGWCPPCHCQLVDVCVFEYWHLYLYACVWFLFFTPLSSDFFSADEHTHRWNFCIFKKKISYPFEEYISTWTFWLLTDWIVAFEICLFHTLNNVNLFLLSFFPCPWEQAQGLVDIFNKRIWKWFESKSAHRRVEGITGRWKCPCCPRSRISLFKSV